MLITLLNISKKIQTFIHTSIYVIWAVSDDAVQQEGSHDGEIMFAVRTYIAENDDALDLVEGEKVYVIGNVIDTILNVKHYRDSYTFRK